MEFNPGQEPLGQQFQNNPLQYMQNFVRNMNNQLFLSQFHINHLYALLLIGRSSPWDSLNPSSLTLKKQVDQLVQKKVKDVNFVLSNLSQIYQDKMKKGALNQIQKLMSVIKAKNKSIYINKTNSHTNFYHHHSHSHHNEKQNNNVKQAQFQDKKKGQQDILENEQQHKQALKVQNNHQIKQSQQDINILINNENKSINSNEPQQSNQNASFHHQQHKKQQQFLNRQSNSQDYQPQQVFGLFYGISNIANISALAMSSGKFLQHNPVQKFIRFRMSKNYIMTIKNQDPSYFDNVSFFKDIPSDMMINQVFPFLTATQLFKARAVSKEWMENVKQAWHATFKRQMFSQLLACQFCKDIQFFYKLIQLRNPFFQKISLLLHALIQIIQWETVYEALNNNTVTLQLKRVLIILLKLIGEPIQIRNLNQINDTVWDLHKHKVLNLKAKVSQFLSNFLGNGDLSINDLRRLKLNLLDNPFMRTQEMQTEDKTPLLLSLFIKQLTLQQILKCHIFFSQQYLLNSKKRLDSISVKMPQQRGYLEGVYKILLLRNMKGVKQEAQDQKSQAPNYQQLIHSFFSRQQSDKPDFIIRGKKSLTNIFIDRATKFDIIVSTVKKMNSPGQEKSINQKQVTESQNSVIKQQQLICESKNQKLVQAQEQTQQQQKNKKFFQQNKIQKQEKTFQTQKDLKMQSNIATFKISQKYQQQLAKNGQQK